MHLAFEIPLRVNSRANASRQGRWRQAAAERKRQRLMVEGVLRGRLSEAHDHLGAGGMLRVHMERIGPRRLDDDNLAAAFKSVRDEVASCLGVDDGPDGPVQWTYSQQRGEPKQYAVRITITTTTPNTCPACGQELPG